MGVATVIHDFMVGCQLWQVSAMIQGPEAANCHSFVVGVCKTHTGALPRNMPRPFPRSFQVVTHSDPPIKGCIMYTADKVRLNGLKIIGTTSLALQIFDLPQT